MARVLVVVLALVLLPLLGAVGTGDGAGAYLRFPPRTAPVSPAPFAWPVFLGLAVAVAAVIVPFLVRILRTPAGTAPAPVAPFPRWGWAGALLLLAGWAIAWGPPDWPDALRRHAFTPLWLGYIVVVNAWTRRRTGTCLLTAHPGTFLLLFPVSAGFWWLFEYLNQFVGNWHYLGLGERGDWAYFWASTPAFATVLPGVLSTRDLLASWPRLEAGLGTGPRLPVLRKPAAGAALIALALAGLVAVGASPERGYPLLWLAPLLLVTGVQGATGAPSFLDGLAEGDWRPLWLAALAALVCGFLWEFWNWGSLARWEYAIPYAGGFHLFAMPALGYAGYLPFGLECAAAAALVLGRQGRRLLNGPSG